MRVAIVMPAMLALAVHVIRQPQLTPFVAFGCFATLVMADFGGPRKPRATAYASAALAGAGLICLGTLASSQVWIAVPAMLVVGVSVQFMSVFGGYPAASVTALLLSFVLSVSIPAPASSIGLRVAGWLLAALVSTTAAVLLWPRFERSDLRRKAAEALTALARFIVAARDPARREAAVEKRKAEDTLARLRQQYGATRRRPAGPMRRDRALVELITQIERALRFSGDPFHTGISWTHPCLREGDKLANEVADALEQASRALNGAGSPDLSSLTAARMAHRRALDQWALDQMRDGRSAEQVMEGLAVDDALRAVSYFTVAMVQNASVAAGFDIPEGAHVLPGVPVHRGPSGVARRVLRTVGVHASPRSSALQGSLRTGLGLGAAVLISRLLRLDHAFWVILGTLTVLRSNALSTGRTTFQALGGTVAGFAVVTVFTALVGATSSALWLALPVAVFLAAYGSTAFGFVAGQAGFTVVVVIVFNIIAPLGWRLGLARLEDVAIGTAISVVVGLILWPRGARRELALQLAGLYRSVAAFLDNRLMRALDPTWVDRAEPLRAAAIGARDRAGEALTHYLNERGDKPLQPETAAQLLAAGTDSILFGDLFGQFAGSSYTVRSCPESSARLKEQLRVLAAAWAHLSDRIAGTAPQTAQPRVSDDEIRGAGLDCLSRWRNDPDAGTSAIATVVTGEWIDQLGEMVIDLEGPAARAGEAARTPWWR